MKEIKLFTDGGARGNPGPAAIGCIFFDENNKEIHKISKYVGELTNNQAEYKAIIAALDWLKGNYEADRVECFLDSLLVVEQLKGNFKVKNQELALLFLKTKNLIESLEVNIEFFHVTRDKNKLADKLVNQALDKELSLK